MAATKRANRLDGKTWTRYSISIWNDIRKTTDEQRLGHPALFPVALVSRLIECFTNEEDQVVLDPFLGIGSTVVAARDQGMRGIGIELYPKFYNIAAERLSVRQLSFRDLSSPEPPPPEIVLGDARNVLRQWKDERGEFVDLVITSPPYWDVLSQERTADGKETRDYGDSSADLGRVRDYQDFLLELSKVFELVHAVMRPGKYCCVVVMDLRKKDRFYPFHSDVASFMQRVGFIYDDLIIWDRRHDYSNMRPLGYPYVFRINKAHEYILIFKKPEAPNAP